MKSSSDNEYGKHLYRELLVIRAKRGDDKAFEEIVREFERPMFYYVRRLVETEQDAWDIVQEIWIKAFPHLALSHRSLHCHESPPGSLSQPRRCGRGVRPESSHRSRFDSTP